MSIIYNACKSVAIFAKRNDFWESRMPHCCIKSPMLAHCPTFSRNRPKTIGIYTSFFRFSIIFPRVAFVLITFVRSKSIETKKSNICNQTNSPDYSKQNPETSMQCLHYLWRTIPEMISMKMIGKPLRKLLSRHCTGSKRQRISVMHRHNVSWRMF